MKLTASSAVLTTMWMASMRAASAFAPRATRAMASRVASPVVPRTFSTQTNMANVMKLSDPKSELLDNVDVFIFDCDGVIWRVG